MGFLQMEAEWAQPSVEVMLEQSKAYEIDSHTLRGCPVWDGQQSSRPNKSLLVR